MKAGLLFSMPRFILVMRRADNPHPPTRALSLAASFASAVLAPVAGVTSSQTRFAAQQAMSVLTKKPIVPHLQIFSCPNLGPGGKTKGLLWHVYARAA